MEGPILILTLESEQSNKMNYLKPFYLITISSAFFIITFKFNLCWILYQSMHQLHKCINENINCI
jgi:hypothetical protein